ncbi:LysR family transcriptional regulator [Phormidium tenue FACHB-886]|nr:LysR family transcriptional regulator [Phormidium tenue FACHB-886]
MELHDLRYFVAVAEDLHFGRAAERLHMTQPALSRQIQALEAELDVQLFQRTKRSVQLTIAGQTFFEEARQILRRTEQAIQTTKRVARGEVGQLRLSFTASALRSVIPEIVRVFRARYPDVQLTMSERCTHEQVAAFHNHQVDVGFLYLPVDEKLLMLQPIVEEVWIVALPKGHHLANQKHLTLSTLTNEAFILHPRHEGTAFYDQIIRLCEQAGFYPNVVQEVETSQTRVGLVAAGMGITFVPEHLQHVADVDVIYRRLKGAAPKLELAIAHRRDNFSPIVQQFLHVVEELKQKSGKKSVA